MTLQGGAWQSFQALIVQRLIPSILANVPGCLGKRARAKASGRSGTLHVGIGCGIS